MAIPKHEVDAGISDAFDLGVFGFAKKTAALAIPMSLVAGIFGIWLRSELLVIRQDFTNAIVLHERQEQTERISRQEFEAFRKYVEERFQTLREQNDDQNKNIQRNTILLERISQRLGVPRPAE